MSGVTSSVRRDEKTLSGTTKSRNLLCSPRKQDSRPPGCLERNGRNQIVYLLSTTERARSRCGRLPRAGAKGVAPAEGLHSQEALWEVIAWLERLAGLTKKSFKNNHSQSGGD